MDERYLIYLALFTSLVGLGGLFVLSYTLDSPLVAILDIDETLLETRVRVEGEVFSVHGSNGVIFFQVRDETGVISAVIFDEDLSVSQGSFVEVVGKVAEYHGEIEIYVEEVREV